MSSKAFLTAAAILLAATGAASAAEHEVKMLNRGAAGAMVFEPAIVKVAPGDSVRFVPTDKSHNAQSIDGMVPAGAEPFVGKLNKEITVTFDKQGIYGFECKPHAAMGMVGVVIVGEPAASDVEGAKAVKVKGKAKKVIQGLLEQVGS